MTSRRGKITVLFLLLFCVLCAGGSRSRLNRMRPDPDDFQELLYVPRGNALKLISLGFTAPLADLLWVKGLIYYSDNMRVVKKDAERGAGREARENRHRYIYELHDVITDLNPRFARAYFYGGLFLLSTGIEDRIDKGILMMEKGLRAFKAAAESGQPIRPDMRWKYHLFIGDAWDNQLQTIYRKRGDWELARQAAAKARYHFRQALNSPNCPPSVAMVVVGEDARTVSDQGVDKQYDAMITTWKSLLSEFSARKSKELAAYAATQLAKLEERRRVIRMTREIESVLSTAVKKFIAANRRKPASLKELLRDGLISELPVFPLDHHELFGNLRDQPVILSDGSVRSMRLTRIEAMLLVGFLHDWINIYFKTKGVFPAKLQSLVDEKFINKIPRHPLAEFGYRLLYHRENGQVTIEVPTGAETGE